MTDFSKIIEGPELDTLFQGRPLRVLHYSSYEGPVTLQYLPYGGIQTLYQGHIVLNTRNGWIQLDELLYDGKIYTSEQFIAEFPHLLNQVLPN